MKGSFTCVKHGSNTPRARQKAQERLLEAKASRMLALELRRAQARKERLERQAALSPLDKALARFERSMTSKRPPR